MDEVQDKDEVSSNLLTKKEIDQNGSEIQAYRRRWIILFIFIVYATVNSYQWIEYSVITNIVMKYYNVSAVTVDWTSTIYMALYAPLVFPASYILDKKGLRVAGLIGCLGTTLGTAIKVFSIGRESFWIVLLGQSIVSASQLLILCLPPRIAAVWFKANEVSTACSLGVFGTQLGCALGFLITPVIVKNHDDLESIGQDFRVLCWGLTVAIIPVAVAIIFYFPKQPPKPPNITQYEERNRKEEFSTKAFLQSIKVLMTNVPFVIHIIAYGINIGVFSAVGPLLNQVVLQYFPNSEEDVGRMGLAMVVVGVLGGISFGVFLDKTHRYKETTLFTYLMSSVSIVAFMFALEMKSKILVYIAVGTVGLFTNAYMPVGFEMAMELTFPSSEGTTTGLLMAPSQIMGVAFIMMMGKINALIGPFWALGSQAVLLVLGTVITCFVPNRLRRQEAFKHRLNDLLFCSCSSLVKSESLIVRRLKTYAEISLKLRVNKKPTFIWLGTTAMTLVSKLLIMEEQDKDEVNLKLLQQKQLNQNHVEIKAYKRRWFVLVLFMLYAGVSAYQWIEYSIITNIVMKYYNVSAVTVDWTSTLYMALYAPLVFPASYILDKKGLRAAGLLGVVGTAIGTSIKVFSIDQNSFWVVLLGQGIVAASQVFILCLPPYIAAVWFKANEVSTACSLGVFGSQTGAALGFLLTPMIVRNHDNPEEIGPDLKKLCWGIAGFIIPVALAVICYFPPQPPKPPSITQYEERKKEEVFSNEGFMKSVKELTTNIPFVIHVIAFGINIGVFSAVGPLLNQVVLQYFPNSEEDVGRMGLVMLLVGMVAAVAFGVFLDKTHRYKESTFGIYLMCALSLVAFMFALELRSKIVVYIAIAVVGWFASAYYPVGFEMAIELTYPSSESTTTGMLVAPSQVMGTVCILVMGKLNAIIGPFWALGSQVALLLIGTTITAFVPNKLRRQEAFKHRLENVQVKEMDEISRRNT